ncbi:MAG: CinA family protein [Planctomycetaceae bacterium]
MAQRLRSSGQRLVLAESCTGGLVAATLAGIPGISEHLCGSAVVYRNATKTAWLGIEPKMLDDPQIGPVSAETTQALALAVLERTPEADLSAAVTGHLGPNAPHSADGRIYVAVAFRDPNRRLAAQMHSVGDVRDSDPLRQRRLRQEAAVQFVLDLLATELTR